MEQRAPLSPRLLLDAIRGAAMFAGAAYAVYYVDATLRRMKGGYRLPVQKAALLVSVGVGSITVVMPGVFNPASSTADFTWAEATGSV